jgi:hypothetical protein
MFWFSESTTTVFGAEAQERNFYLKSLTFIRLWKQSNTRKSFRATLKHEYQSQLLQVIVFDYLHLFDIAGHIFATMSGPDATTTYDRSLSVNDKW